MGLATMLPFQSETLRISDLDRDSAVTPYLLSCSSKNDSLAGGGCRVGKPRLTMAIA